MKYKIFLLVFILSLISSIILASSSLTGVCKLGGCTIVNASIYGSILGIKNSIYGIFIFSFLTLITLIHIKKPKKFTKVVINSAIVIGSIIAAYFLYLQIFIIKAFCKFCLIIDLGLIISLIFLVSNLFDKNGKEI